MDRGGWQATVHGVSKSLTQMNDEQCKDRLKKKKKKMKKKKKNYPN